MPGGVELVCDGEGVGVLITPGCCCAFGLVAWRWARLLAVVTLNKCTN